MKTLHQHKISFKHAIDGLIYVVKSQPNFQIHLIFATVALFLGKVLHISRIEWQIVILLISLVIIAEMANTALESVVDLLTSKYDLNAKIAKDVSAGLVLVCAIASVIIGLIIFLPKIIYV